MHLVIVSHIGCRFDVHYVIKRRGPIPVVARSNA